MQVAEIISDLTSLRVCDHADALTLVTANERLPPSPSMHTSMPDGPLQSRSHANSTPATTGPKRNTDGDLRRAKELVDLHQGFKARHADGAVDEELARARVEVGRVLRELNDGSG